MLDFIEINRLNDGVMNKANLMLLGLSVALAGCTAAPTRDNHEEFESKASGNIPTDRVLDFSSCVYDGFTRSHSMMTSVDTRQQVRPEGYRVETFAGGHILLMSADILNTGKVELWESSAAALIDTSEERNTFSSCLHMYKND